MLFVTGCASMRINRAKPQLFPIPETTKKLDIPKYDANHPFGGYPFIFWHFAKQKERQLGLESPEFSKDSLIFRVWITNPIGRTGQPHGLIEIRHDFTEWSGTLYAMYVDFDPNNLTETITSYRKMELFPKRNDWNFIVDSLFLLKFDVLPTDDAIPNYPAGYGSRRTTFSFEFATRTQYRFFQYYFPARAANDFWQARNVLKILDLLDDELGWDSLWRDAMSLLTPTKDYSKYLRYSFRIDVGVLNPLGNLRNNLGISPHFGVLFGFPFTEKYRVDVGLNFFIPANRLEIMYFPFNGGALSGRATWGGTMGVWGSRTDMIRRGWFIDNRLGLGLGFLGTNIRNPNHQPNPNPWENNHNSRYLSSETIFFNLGTGIRRGRIGLSLNYFFVPHGNLKSDFGNQYLTIGTYITF